VHDLAQRAIDVQARRAKESLDLRPSRSDRPVGYRLAMTQDEDQDRTEPAVEGLNDGDAGRQIAHVTGMSADAAATFAAFHSGRFAHRSSFRDAA
jgi:hypothetical protein